MLKDLKKIHRNPKFLILTILLSFFTFIITINIVNKVFYYENLFSGKAQLNKVYKILDADRENLYQSAKKIAHSPDMVQAFKDDDLEKINYLITEEKEASAINLIMAINRNGVAISRKSLPTHVGDYILKNKNWENILKNGHEINIIEPGTNYIDLLMKSVHPIMVDNEFIGAMVLAKKLDDQYALELKKILNYNAEIIFYSQDSGIVASSFELDTKQYTGNETKFFMSQYFNTRSNLAQNDDKEKIHLAIDGIKYNISNIDFIKVNNKNNGLLILHPQSYSYTAMLIASIFSILLAYLLIQYLKNKNKKFLLKNKVTKKNTAIISFILLINWILLTFIANSLFRNNYHTLKIPDNLIYNSVLKIQPENSIIDKNFQYTMSIKIEPGGEDINAISTNLNYDPQMVNVLDIIKTDSICRQDLFLEQLIDNQKGQVRISCVLPDFNLLIKEGKIADLVIQAQQTGPFVIEFDPSSQVLANDGLGTNVLRTHINASYQTQDLTEQHSINNLAIPIIISPTHPNNARWYNKKDIKLSWLNHHEHKYIYLLDKNPKSIPKTEKGISIDSTDSIELSIKEDGVYYFHLQVDKEDIEFPTAHFKLMIDATPPNFVEKRASHPEIKTGEVSRISFEAQDDQSGLQSYYIKIDNNIFLPVVPPLYIPFHQAGIHNIMIRAYDNTDNYIDELIQVKVNGRNLFEKIINIDLIKWFR
jgi:hypothetical protein